MLVVDVLTVAQVAEYLKLSDKTIRRMISSGQLKASKVRGSWRIKETDVEKYLNAHTNGKKGV